MGCQVLFVMFGQVFNIFAGQSLTPLCPPIFAYIGLVGTASWRAKMGGSPKGGGEGEADIREC